MNKYNLDKPIIFDKPILIPVPKSVQNKAWDYATVLIRKCTRSGIYTEFPLSECKNTFVKKISESAVGQWMRQELNAPVIPTNFSLSEIRKSSFPYHSEYGKLKDVHVEACVKHDDSIGWNFHSKSTLLIDGNRNDVVVLTVAKDDKVIGGNNSQLYAILPLLVLKTIVDELKSDDESRYVSWELLRKKIIK
jgi:hypothetical protein